MSFRKNTDSFKLEVLCGILKRNWTLSHCAPNISCEVHDSSTHCKRMCVVIPSPTQSRTISLSRMETMSFRRTVDNLKVEQRKRVWVRLSRFEPQFDRVALLTT